MRLGPVQRQNALARTLAARSAPYIDLTRSNPAVADLFVAPAALPAAPVYEPHPLGLPGARAAVAAYQDVSPDRVILTASTREAYSWLFKLLCAAGDEVLVPEPSYPLFGYLTALECVRAVPPRQLSCLLRANLPCQRGPTNRNTVPLVPRRGRRGDGSNIWWQRLTDFGAALD